MSVQEFRPAPVVEADAALAVAIGRGDVDAVRELWARYAAPVYAIALRAHALDTTGAERAAIGSFVRVVERVDTFDARRGFAPDLVEALEVDLADDDVDLTWAAVRAVETLDGEDGGPASMEARRRIEQRVGHLLGESSVDDVLTEPWLWRRPVSSLLDAVLGEVRSSETSTGDPQPATDGDEDASSRRQVRPVVLGLVGAIAALFVGILLLSALSGTPEPADVSADLVPTGAIADVSGSAEITEVDSGLRLELDVASLPPTPGGSFYEVVLLLVDGTTRSAGSFTEGGSIRLSAGVTLDPVTDLEIVEVVGASRSVVLKLDLTSVSR